MENRFLCRGKRIDTGEWVQGVPSYGEDGKIEEIEVWDGEDITFYPVFPGTICRCTGRTDRDEKLIFEHDVIAFLDTYSTESGYAEADCIGKVVWDDETMSFQVTNRLSAESYEVLDECSVIGNAIDNPELLEMRL
ncbi:MAG: YopX family protein [Roseburia faecis]|jgi:uncharacterized phage protein (TIGR01671 family)